MAIRNRRGNLLQFDKSRLLSGEFAYVLDTGELFYCYGANQVKKLATEEDLQDILDASSSSYTALLQLIEDLESNPSEITNILSNISDLEDEDIAIYQSISALELKFNNAILLANKNVYISPTGSDTTGTGSSGNPYKTFNKALSVIPKNLNGFDGIINIESGVYNERVLVLGYNGGTLAFSFRGDTSINAIEIQECTFVHIPTPTLCTLTITDNINQCIITRGSNVRINNMNIIINGGGNSNGIYVSHCSKLVIVDKTTTINNVVYNAVAVQDNSQCYINELNGVSNNVGILVATGSEFSYSIKTISATTEKVLNGGIITNDLIPTKKSIFWAGTSVIPLTSLCYKLGDMVHVDFRMPTTTPIVPGSVIGELPIDCRPSVSTGYIYGGVAYQVDPSNNTTRSFAVVCSVQSNGQITIASDIGLTMYNATVSFEFFVK